MHFILKLIHPLKVHFWKHMCSPYLFFPVVSRIEMCLLRQGHAGNRVDLRSEAGCCADQNPLQEWRTPSCEKAARDLPSLKTPALPRAPLRRWSHPRTVRKAQPFWPNLGWFWRAVQLSGLLGEPAGTPVDAVSLFNLCPILLLPSLPAKVSLALW